jgi:cytosine/adenosine deaminase-related metal-dependent hydrolase
VAALVLRNARILVGEGLEEAGADLVVVAPQVRERTEAGGAAAGATEIDLAGRLVLPGLVNAHDHLDFSVFPPLGRPPYASVYDWSADVAGGANDPDAQAALAVPEVDRLFLGGVRNLLTGVTGVVHHGPFHRSLSRPDFPVQVQERYQFAHSPGLTPALRRTYRSTDRRIPWFVHVAEGVDERVRGELAALVEANVLRHNTVIVHGVALGEEDARRLAEAEACVVWCPESNRHLYGATAAIGLLQAAGVRIALGSDSPVSGVRDPLSNLAAARREGVMTDAALVRLATEQSAEVARLPGGGVDAGDVSDLIAVESLDAFLDGRRDALALVMRSGRIWYGAPHLWPAGTAVHVDGTERRLERATAQRLAGLLKRYPQIRRSPWLSSVHG